MSGILIAFHTPSNAGYAMRTLEKTFFDMAVSLTGSANDVHFSFKNLKAGKPDSLPEDFNNIFSLDIQNNKNNSFKQLKDYIKTNDIDTVFCFDYQLHFLSPLSRAFRTAGVKNLISYWGALISDYNQGAKLLAKKIEVKLTPYKPNLFIFESESMRSYATHGRGIPSKMTKTVYLGVDHRKYTPDNKSSDYLYQKFKIPKHAKVAFYSGHMEERKGVKTIVQAAIELIQNRQTENLYFLICGNRPGEEERFLNMLPPELAQSKVLFAGYRNDLELIMPNCTVGVIASTGWDSFTMSSLEMASSGLPLLVSRLQGLTETIDEGETGFSFNPRDHIDLSNKLEMLLSETALAQKLSGNARKRIENRFTKEKQIESLVKVIQEQET